MVDLAELSERFPIIVLAYVAAFLPWSAFNTHDFISDSWKTIHRTRRAGYINLLFSVFPAVYILFYAATQFKGEDHKEGCTAVIALFFALLHGVRSAWGLWQLHAFRTWCAKSIDALGAMGVQFRFTDQRRRDKVQEQDMTSWQMADEILVNNTIIDNQINHGDTVSHIRFDNVHVVPPPWLQSWTGLAAFKLLWNYTKYCAWTLLSAFVMLADSLRFTVGARTSGKVRQVPKNPIEVWINWSVPFAAQGLQEWISLFNVSEEPTSVEEQDGDKTNYGVDKWQKRNEYFASEVLSTCIMVLRPELKGKNCSKMDPMLWRGWKPDSKMHGGRTVKSELLEEAMKSGLGLPFGVPHIKESNKNTLGSTLGYAAFREYVESKARNLEVKDEFCSEATKLNVEKLEWLMILLYMGRRSTDLQKEYLGNSYGFSEKERVDDNTRVDCSTVKIDEHTENEELDQAKINLQEQLSLPFRTDYITEKCIEESRRGRKLIVPSFPFSTKWKNLRSVNRNVLKIGEVVDIWLSLVAGDGLKFVLKINEKWRTICSGSGCIARVGEQNKDDSTGRRQPGRHQCNEESYTSISLRDVHKEVEILGLRFQFGDKDCKCEWGANYGMTFVGYTMEFVRSKLAEWAFRVRNKKGNEGDGKARFQRRAASMEKGVCNVSRECTLSDGLSRALRFGDVMSNVQSRLFQCRLVFELQEHLQTCVSRMGVDEIEGVAACPESSDLIALGILSFPSLDINMKSKGPTSDECGSVTSTRDWYGIPLGYCSSEMTEDQNSERSARGSTIVVFEAVCAPQRCQVEVCLASREDGKSKAVISVNFKDEEEFVWEWWRDAFTGRLQGMKEWQENHFLKTSLNVVPTSNAVDMQFEVFRTVTNERFHVWKGWRPFRVETCLFELQHSELLKESRIVERPPISLDKEVERISFRILSHERSQACYDSTDIRVIYHGMNLIRESLERKLKIREGDLENKSEDGDLPTEQIILDTAEELSKSDVGAIERAVLLYEAAAGAFGSELALEKGTDVILRSSNISNSRINSLVGMFIGNRIPCGILNEARLDARTILALKRDLLRTCRKVIGCRQVSIRDLPSLILISQFAKVKERHEVLNIMEIHLCCSQNFAALVEYSEIHDVITYKEKRSRSSQVRRIECTTRSATERVSNNQRRDTVRGDKNVFGQACFIDGTSSSAQHLKYCIHLCEVAAWKRRSILAFARLGTFLLREVEGVQPQPSNAVKMVWNAIKGGYVQCFPLLGRLYSAGAEGVEKDTMYAKRIFEWAIDEYGCVYSMCELAQLLEKGGEGIAKDAIRAMELYERAARDGNDTGAMNRLGMLLHMGTQGVAKNDVLALKWYERAIEDGNVYAMAGWVCC